jgi:hypothetical protein
MNRQPFVYAAFPLAFSIACGGIDGSTDPTQSNDNVQAIGSVEQGIGEVACTDWSNIDVNVGFAFNNAQSPDGNYGHARCAHAFNVMVGLLVRNPGQIFATYQGGNADGVVFPCNGEWVRMVLWGSNGIGPDGQGKPFPNKPVGWVKLLDQQAFGRAVGGGCFAPTVASGNLVPDAYVASVTAGYATTFQPVSVLSGGSN